MSALIFRNRTALKRLTRWIGHPAVLRATCSNEMQPKICTSVPSLQSFSLNHDHGFQRRTFSDSSQQQEPEEQHKRTRLLAAAIDHVNRLGWSEAAIAEAAQEMDLSPSVVGMFARGEVELVEYFMEDCRQKLVSELDKKAAQFADMSVRDRMIAIIRERLELQALFIASWPQALSIQARPANVASTLSHRNELLEVLWRASGDQGSGLELYAKKALLAGAYATTEVYMLTDYSPGFEDTWKFLERQVEAVLEANKIGQQASFAAQAMTAGFSKVVGEVLRKGTTGGVP